MSIINDALKKADRLKKWKPNSETVVPQAVVELPQISMTENIPNLETPTQKAPEVIPEPIPQKASSVSIEQPPFKVTFTKTHQEKKPTYFSLPKIIAIVFAACGFFVLLIGPWISMMLDRSIAEIKPASTSTQRSAVITEPAMAPEPIKVIEPVPEVKAPPLLKSYKSYSSPNVGVSVRPIPRTVQQKDPELVFKLTGISDLGNGEYVAFINGKVVETGNKIGDAEVTQIEEKQVSLRRGGRLFKLTLES